MSDGLCVWKLQDGASHWVIARWNGGDPTDAVRLYNDLYGVDAVPVTASLLSHAELVAAEFVRDDGVRVSMWNECKRDWCRRYVACSEL